MKKYGVLHWRQHWSLVCSAGCGAQKQAEEKKDTAAQTQAQTERKALHKRKTLHQLEAKEDAEKVIAVIPENHFCLTIGSMIELGPERWTG